VAYLANCKYALFGQEFVESQGKMMTRVFEELLSRHPEKMDTALEQFHFLSVINYNQDISSLRDAPSAFLNKQTFIIAGHTIFIGTSYNMKQKLSYIKRLFLLCGEDPHQFQIIAKDTLPPVAKPSSQHSSKKKRREESIRYRLFGKEYESNQAEMMYLAFEEIFSRNPALMDWAIEHLHCASWTDFTLQESKEKKFPSQFKTCRCLYIAGKSICIGSGYNLKAKLNLIENLRQQAGMPKEIFVPHPSFKHALTLWQKEAVEAVLDAYNNRKDNSNTLGIVSMPTVTGKTVLLAALFSQFMQLEKSNFSILLLTSTTDLASHYTETLSNLIGPIYSVEIAQTRKALAEKASTQGTILVSTAQKLLGDRFLHNDITKNEPLTPFSTSSRLLVVVEEATYNYFSRTYQDMHARFPNAIFFGLTNYWTPSKKLYEAFGELLYQYSFEQAYRDGLLRMVDYYCVNTLTAQSDAVTFEGFSKGRVLNTNEAYRAKTEQIVKQIEQAGKNAFALLLCNSHSTAIGFYDSLMAYESNTKFEIYFDLHPKNSFMRQNIEIPEKLEKINDDVFQKCPIKKIVLPSSIRIVGDYALDYKKAEEITLPSNLSDFSYLSGKINNLRKINTEWGSYEIPESHLIDGREIIDIYLFLYANHLVKEKYTSLEDMKKNKFIAALGLFLGSCAVLSGCKGGASPSKLILFGIE